MSTILTVLCAVAVINFIAVGVWSFFKVVKADREWLRVENERRKLFAERLEEIARRINTPARARRVINVTPPPGE